jgi:hypothetical protein
LLFGCAKSEDLGIGGRIVLEWILENWDEKVLTGFIWIRIENDGGGF